MTTIQFEIADETVAPSTGIGGEARFAYPVTIHIGAPKSATTSLEENLYENHPGIVNIGRPYKREVTRKMLVGALEGDPAPLIRGIDAICAKGPADARMVLCDDFICGLWVRDGAATPKALKKVFPEARIMLTVRNQISSMPSLYLQNNEQVDFDLDSWVEFNLANIRRQYDFDAQVTEFAQEFGEDRVGVFLFEDMLADVDEFARKVCHFIDVDCSIGATLLRRPNRNPRMSHRQLLYLRLKGRLFRNADPSGYIPDFLLEPLRRLLFSGKGAKINLRADLEARIVDSFRAGNARLDSRLGLGLARYGYPL